MPRNWSYKKFGRVRNFRRLHSSSREIFFMRALFTSCYYSPLQPLFLLAARFCFLFSFWFSSYFLLVIVFIFLVFGNLYYGLAIKAPLTRHCKKNFCSVIKSAGSFQLSHSFLFSLHFLSFSLPFSLAKHPPRMTTRRMSG